MLQKAPKSQEAVVPDLSSSCVFKTVSGLQPSGFRHQILTVQYWTSSLKSSFPSSCCPRVGRIVLLGLTHSPHSSFIKCPASKVSGCTTCVRSCGWDCVNDNDCTCDRIGVPKYSPVLSVNSIISHDWVPTSKRLWSADKQTARTGVGGGSCGGCC